MFACAGGALPPLTRAVGDGEQQVGEGDDDKGLERAVVLAQPGRGARSDGGCRAVVAAAGAAPLDGCQQGGSLLEGGAVQHLLMQRLRLLRLAATIAGAGCRRRT